MEFQDCVNITRAKCGLGHVFNCNCPECKKENERETKKFFDKIYGPPHFFDSKNFGSVAIKTKK